MSAEELRPRRYTGNKWLYNIWNAKKLESEYGTCSVCGKENIEVLRWQLGDGSIKKIEHCPDCNAKYQEMEKQEEETARQAEIMGTRRRGREESSIPPKFMNEDFSSFKHELDWQKKAFDRCWEYVESFPIGQQRPRGYPSLYIFSEESWGVGKTHLSCAMAHRLLDRWKGEGLCPSIKWVSEPDLFARIQATFNYSYEEKRYLPTEDDIIKELIYRDLVILDDVGKEKRQDPRFVQRTLFKIINGRYDQDLPIIITANLNPAGLREHLGAGDNEASYDRFWGMTKDITHRIKMDGDSYRRK